MLTREQFATLFQGLSLSKQDPYREAINAAMEEFQIDSKRRQAAFLAQISHETAGLHFLQELGNDEYFKKYDGRMGNTNPGDGARYKGRGAIMLTGHDNYFEFGRALGLNLLENPERAGEMPVAARIAGRFWKTRDCNELADQDRFLAITRKINGGTNGLDDRWKRWNQARLVLGLSPVVRA